MASETLVAVSPTTMKKGVSKQGFPLKRVETVAVATRGKIIFPRQIDVPLASMCVQPQSKLGLFLLLLYFLFFFSPFFSFFLLVLLCRRQSRISRAECICIYNTPATIQPVWPAIIPFRYNPQFPSLSFPPFFSRVVITRARKAEVGLSLHCKTRRREA